MSPIFVAMVAAAPKQAKRQCRSPVLRLLQALRLVLAVMPSLVQVIRLPVSLVRPLTVQAIRLQARLQAAPQTQPLLAVQAQQAQAIAVRRQTVRPAIPEVHSNEVSAIWPT